MRKVRLWTYQSKGFSLTDPNISVDVTKSRYNRFPSYKDTHAQLSEKIGAEKHQIIFCYTNYDSRPDEAEILWELEVPENEVHPIHSPTWEELIKDSEKQKDDGMCVKLHNVSIYDGETTGVLKHPIDRTWVLQRRPNPARRQNSEDS